MLEWVIDAFGIELTSAVIGGIGGLTTYGFLNWNQRRIRRDRFRRSLVYEITHIGHGLERLGTHLDTPEDSDPVDFDELQARLTTDLLDSDFRSIGKLTTRELQHVYRFYEMNRVVCDKIADGVPETERTRLRTQVETALEKRNTALAHINRSRLSKLTEWYKDIDAAR